MTGVKGFDAAYKTDGVTPSVVSDTASIAVTSIRAGAKREWCCSSKT